MIPRLTGAYPRHTLLVTLPEMPRVLTGNGATRAHPMKFASASAQAFQDGQRAMRAALGHYDPPRWRSIIGFPIFYFRGRQHRDDDNYTFGLKHYRDGMADLLGINDEHWRWERTAMLRDALNLPSIIVIVCDAEYPTIVPEHADWLRGTQRAHLNIADVIASVTSAYATPTTR